MRSDRDQCLHIRLCYAKHMYVLHCTGKFISIYNSFDFEILAKKPAITYYL